MDIEKSVKSKAGQYVLIGAAIGAGVGLLISANILAFAIIGAAVGYFASMKKGKLTK